MAPPFRILIVDDSSLFAEVFYSILDADPELTVVGIATDGRQAIEMALRLKPHLITMDVNMPVMNGLEAVEHIMGTNPTPILVVSSDPRIENGDLTYNALRRGALDVLLKPESWDVSEAEKEDIRERVKFLADVTVVRHRRTLSLSSPTSPDHVTPAQRDETATERQLPPVSPPTLSVASPSWPPCEIVQRPTVSPATGERGGPGTIIGIVASTGGPSALAKIFEQLPASFPVPILVVQHIASGFTESLASWLNDISSLSVALAIDAEPILPGRVLLAPDEHHMTVSLKRRISLDTEPPLEGHIPSGSRLLSSLARSCGQRSIGVILTGMGRDGIDGLCEIRAAGGETLAQDESSSVVFGMPKVAWQTGGARSIVPLHQIPAVLCSLVGADPADVRGPS